MSRIVDLSHPLGPGMPHAVSVPAPRFTALRTLEEHGLRCMRLDLPTHCGTHLDVPAHFFEDGADLDAVPPEALIGRARCVRVEAAPGLPIGPEQLLGARAVGRPAAEFLLIRSGWDALYDTAEYLDHPYLSEQAAEWIVEAGFRTVGLDLITVDRPAALRPPGFTFPAHRVLLGNDVLILENLDLRAAATDRDFELFVGVLPVAHADGAPARVLARIPEAAATA